MTHVLGNLGLICVDAANEPRSSEPGPGAAANRERVPAAAGEEAAPQELLPKRGRVCRGTRGPSLPSQGHAV